jgi:hypothetical protein
MFRLLLQLQQLNYFAAQLLDLLAVGSTGGEKITFGNKKYHLERVDPRHCDQRSQVHDLLLQNETRKRGTRA